MNLDIQTLSVTLSVLVSLQVIALFIQFRINRSIAGSLYWALGNFSIAIAFALNYLRAFSTLASFFIVANNFFFIAGVSLLYIGTLRFLHRNERYALLAAFTVGVTLAILYFSAFDDNLPARRSVISLAMALLSFRIAYALVKFRTGDIAASVGLLAAVFLFHGLFWAIRGLSPLFYPAADLFAPSLFSSLTYLAMLVTSTLWTFGFILLVNQRLNAENREDNESLELIFDSSPDAVLITRVSDGMIVKVNGGFTALSGFSREEVMGKSVYDLNIWNDTEDRTKLVTELRAKGICERMEILLRHRDGSLHSGILSAKLLSLAGVPHFITVAHDITERKQSERKVRELVHQLEIEKRYAEKSAMTDGLTGLSNRRYFDDMLNAAFFSLRRTDSPLTLIMLDIDFFKKYNDRYGHVAGDECLRKVADILKTVVFRPLDVIARYGGEEFVIILPDTDRAGAEKLAERTLKAVEDMAIAHEASDISPFVTVSIGVTTVHTNTLATPEQAVELADAALYLAKKEGRNRVRVIDRETETGGENGAAVKSGFVRLVWHASNECGNSVIDAQHQRLFDASNLLISAILESSSKAECAALLDALLAEVVRHFGDEEEILEEIGYPSLEDHRICHGDLMAKAKSLAGRYDRDELPLAELLGFLVYDVVAQHLFVEDRKFFPYI